MKQDTETLKLTLDERDRQLQAVFELTSILYRCTKEGMGTSTLDMLLQETLRVALDAVRADAGTLYLYSPENDTLVLRYVVGEKAHELTGTEIPSHKGIAGEVFQSGQVRINMDVRKDGAHLQQIGERIGYTAHNMITVALRDLTGKPVGVLQAMNKRNGIFDEHDMNTLSIVATLAGTAIETARIQEEYRLAFIARLLGNISHDIKNMLTPVITASQTLLLFYEAFREELESIYPAVEEPHHQRLRKACDDLDSFFKEAMQMIAEGGEHLQACVRDIADVVKGVSVQISPEPTDLKEVAQKVLLMLTPAAQARGVALRLEAASPLQLVLVDAKQIFRAMYNLVNNAFPETPSGGSIIVRLSIHEGEQFPNGSFAGIEVADTGAGMPPEVKEWLFTKRMVSTKQGGTGLGTQIVKNVVDAHGGVIWVDSEQNKGTTFTIRLPLRLPDC